MANRVSPRRAPDRIDPNRDADLRYWSKKLGVAREELLAAVKAAGDRIDNITEHLSKQSASGPTS